MLCQLGFEGSKLALREVACHTCESTHCYNKKCTKVVKPQDTKGMTYAMVTKIGLPTRKSMNFLKTIRKLKMRASDNNLESIQVVTGGLVSSSFHNILLLLSSHFCSNMGTEKFSDQELTKALMDFVKIENNYSKIGDHKSKDLSINLSVRNSLSVTFQSDLVEKIADIIKPKLLERFMTKPNMKIIDIKIHPDHGDIILYQDGGKFNVHRDKKLKFPFKDVDPRGWVMHSYILCLDSNLDDRIVSHEGNTVVHLPPYPNMESKLYDEEVSSFSCIPHVFNESVIPGEFIGFPAQARHSSVEIATMGKYKFILKLDFWLKFQSTGSEYFKADYRGRELVPNPTMSDLYCNCKLCDPIKQRLPSFYFHFLGKTLKKLDRDTIRLIMDYIDINDYPVKPLKVDRTRYFPEYSGPWEYPGDEYEDDESDGYCNGWDY